MPAVDFKFGTSLPEAYKDLLWDVFFVQRGRGLSLTAHFPVFAAKHPDLWCATLSAGSELLAGLVIKQQPAHQPSSRVGVIGLVCVRPSARGQGLSTQLLERTLGSLDRLGLAGITLWTSKPGVYSKLGFEFEDDACFGAVAQLPRREQALQMRPWPDAQERAGANRGLPPYAWYAQRIAAPDGSASAIVIYDADGAALAEWSGEEHAVLELLQGAMPSRWRLNALRTDALPQLLAKAGARVELAPARLQMWKSLRPGSLAERPHFRLLDRI